MRKKKSSSQPDTISRDGAGLIDNIYLWLHVNSCIIYKYILHARVYITYMHNSD